VSVLAATHCTLIGINLFIVAFLL